MSEEDRIKKRYIPNESVGYTGVISSALSQCYFARSRVMLDKQYIDFYEGSVKALWIILLPSIRPDKKIWVKYRETLSKVNEVDPSKQESWYNRKRIILLDNILNMIIGELDRQGILVRSKVETGATRV